MLLSAQWRQWVCGSLKETDPETGAEMQKTPELPTGPWDHLQLCTSQGWRALTGMGICWLWPQKCPGERQGSEIFPHL